MSYPIAPSPFSGSSVSSPRSSVLSPASTELSSIDMSLSYPMFLPNLGHGLVLNNLATELPDTVQDVETLTTTLTKIGFKVKQYQDMNFKGMKQIKESMTKTRKHQNCNCFLFAVICHTLEEGWLLDMNKIRAYSLEQLTDEVCAVPTLDGKPKVILIEEYRSGGAEHTGELKRIEKDDLYIALASNSISNRKQSSGSFLRTLGVRMCEESSTESFVHVVNSVKLFMPTPASAKLHGQRLTDAELAELAAVISSPKMQNMAVRHMGFTEDQVETLVDECLTNKQSFNRKVLIQWRNRNGTENRKKLLDILRDSAKEGQVNLDACTQILQVEGKTGLTIQVFDSFTQQLHFSEYSSTKQRFRSAPKSRLPQKSASSHPENSFNLQQELLPHEPQRKRLRTDRMIQEIPTDSRQADGTSTVPFEAYTGMNVNDPTSSQSQPAPLEGATTSQSSVPIPSQMLPPPGGISKSLETFQPEYKRPKVSDTFVQQVRIQREVVNSHPDYLRYGTQAADSPSSRSQYNYTRSILNSTQPMLPSVQNEIKGPVPGSATQSIEDQTHSAQASIPFPSRLGQSFQHVPHNKPAPLEGATTSQSPVLTASQMLPPPGGISSSSETFQPGNKRLKRVRCFELQMSASFDIKYWYIFSSITAIESKNQVVIRGKRHISHPYTLFTFQNNPDGELVETWMDVPCQHIFSLACLTTVVKNEKELLAVSCDECKDIKLVDLETKQVTPVFQFPPTDPLVHMCSGPDSRVFVCLFTKSKGSAVGQLLQSH